MLRLSTHEEAVASPDVAILTWGSALGRPCSWLLPCAQEQGDPQSSSWASGDLPEQQASAQANSQWVFSIKYLISLKLINIYHSYNQGAAMGRRNNLHQDSG